MINIIRFKIRHLTASLIFWLILLVVQMDFIRLLGFTLLEALEDSLISNILLGLACFVVFNNMRYYLPRKEKYRYVFFISSALGSITFIATRILISLIFSSDISYTAFFQKSGTVRFGFSWLILCIVSTISLLWYNQKEKITLDENKKDIEKLSVQTELLMLRQQLQPHFLFNSLNSISALTIIEPEKARQMIQHLSDFLRGSLRQEDQQWNRLEQELTYLGLYLEIEKVRFGNRLCTEITIEENIRHLQLPTFILQPVVENAIKFGLYDTLDEVTITMDAREKDNMLQITIKNPFDETTAQPIHGTGFGLQSIKRRLFLLFGRNDLLQTMQENNTFITQIQIPKTV